MSEQPIDNYVILANYTDKYTLTVEISGTSYGSTNPTAGTYSYDPGSTATVTAASKTGGQFDGWTGDGTGSGATRTITMNGNKSVKAWFSEKQAPSTYSVTGTASPSTYGTVTGSASGLSDGAAWSLTASAKSGYKFTKWSSGETTKTISGNINGADVTRTAYFDVASTFTVNYYAYRDASKCSYESVTEGSYCTNVPSASTLTSSVSGWSNNKFSFSHWTIGVGGSIFDPSTTPVTQDLNLYAVWTWSGSQNYTLTNSTRTETKNFVPYMPGNAVVTIGGTIGVEHGCPPPHEVDISYILRRSGTDVTSSTSLGNINTSVQVYHIQNLTSSTVTVPKLATYAVDTIRVTAARNDGACQVMWDIDINLSVTLS